MFIVALTVEEAAKLLRFFQPPTGNNCSLLPDFLNSHGVKVELSTPYGERCSLPHPGVLGLQQWGYLSTPYEE